MISLIIINNHHSQWGRGEVIIYPNIYCQVTLPQLCTNSRVEVTVDCCWHLHRLILELAGWIIQPWQRTPISQKTNTRTHTHAYIYICVCVCVNTMIQYILYQINTSQPFTTHLFILSVFTNLPSKKSPQARQQVSHRLAGARLRHTNDITTTEASGTCLRLDGRGLGIAMLSDPFQQLLALNDFPRQGLCCFFLVMAHILQWRLKDGVRIL